MSSKFGRLPAIALAILVAVGFFAPASGQQSPSPATTLRVAYTPVVPWMLAWIAKDKGYFQAQGLDVQFTEVQNPSLLPGLVGKQFDIVPSTPPDLIKAAVSGLDVIGISGATIETATNGGAKLISRDVPGIKNIADLAGKTIATPSLGAINHVATLYWLKRSGVDIHSIHAVEVAFPNMPDMLKSGQVDAAESVEPFNAVILAAGGVSLGDEILAVADPVRTTLWIGSASWSRANRPVIARWLAALKEAQNFSQNNLIETRAIAGKYTRLPDAIMQKVALPDQQLTLTPRELEIWFHVLADLGLVTGTTDINALIAPRE
jgi:ABC-type nitrate/sulfonate/bicarbonate transport system substrate-binding protein